MTSSVSGSDICRSCFRIQAVSCYLWSALVRWCPSPSGAIVTQLVARPLGLRPDHGDLGTDLRDHLCQLAAFLTTTDAGAVCRALTGQAQHDPAVAAWFESEFAVRQRDRDRAPFTAHAAAAS